MHHSRVSPSLSPRNTAMPSGTVALSEVDPGLAIDTFDLRFMFQIIFLGLFISTYVLAEEFIYGFLLYAIWVKRMATQIQTRKQRGEQIIADDIEQINPESFWVKSQSGKGGYSVTMFQGKWTCDCFDHKYRQIKCKHVYAIETYISEHSAKSVQRFSLGLWEAQK